MASSRILARNRQVVKAYLPNLRAMVMHFRAFSSYDEQRRLDNEQVGADTQEYTDAAELIWPDKKLGPLANKDRRFALPGAVGTGSNMSSPRGRQEPLKSATMRPVSSLLDPNIASRAVPAERHASVMREFLSAMAQEGDNEYVHDEPLPMDTLECLAQICPDLLRKDFQDLFPARSIRTGPLTVITISQKTKHDMTSWSQDVQQEREDLLEQFISGATEICESLAEAGFWADFIEPSSGRPFLGAYTNATLFETDERYRHFGFEIRDLGCCKVIAHHLWGTRAYVGCLFTNAPIDSPVLKSLMRKADV